MPHDNPDEDSNGQRRRFSRAGFETAARLRAGGRDNDCIVLDLSLKGALIGSPAAAGLREGEACVLDIPLDSEGTTIRMQGEVAHVEAEHAGLRWLEIDLDSLTHLRRLLALNLGDNALMERELSALLER